jgi:predicted transcriptional regulator
MLRIKKRSERNRGRLEIIAEILTELREPAGRTNIMSQCNMSGAQSGQYLHFMKSKDLILKNAARGRATYQRTEVGLKFLEIYNKMALMLDPNVSTPWWRLTTPKKPIPMV